MVWIKNDYTVCPEIHFAKITDTVVKNEKFEIKHATDCKEASLRQGCERGIAACAPGILPNIMSRLYKICHGIFEACLECKCRSNTLLPSMQRRPVCAFFLCRFFKGAIMTAWPMHIYLVELLICIGT
jgi:hypothetical protein